MSQAQELEYTTLAKCVDQVANAVESNLSETASYLFDKALLSREIYQEILEFGSANSNADKAKKLVLEILKLVQLDSSKYYKFVNLLRLNEGKCGDIIGILDSQYFGIKANSKIAFSHGQDKLNSEILHKELSVVQEKWFGFGSALKISTELLHQFANLADPLLEVIIHWLRGSVDFEPSWNLLADALRDDRVNESELADKLERLYCTELGEARGRDEDSADSDISSQLERINLKSNYHLLPKTDLRSEHQKLQEGTKKMKEKFSQLVLELQQHMIWLEKSGEIDVSSIKRHIVLYNRKLKEVMAACKSLPDIFETLCLPQHSSFLEYDSISLFADYGSAEIKHNFTEYKRALQKFFENRIIELHREEGKNSFAVVIDGSITREVTDWARLQNRVKNILGHKTLSLIHWDSLEKHSEHPCGRINEEVSLAPRKFSEHKSATASSVSTGTLRSCLGEETSSIPSSQGVSPKANSLNQETSTDATTGMLFSDNVLSNNEADALSQSATTVQDSLVNQFEDDFIQMLDSARQLLSSSELHKKANEGDLQGIIGMMKEGHNPMDADENGNMAPHYAARSGHIDVVKYFVDELGFNPTISGNQGQSLLHLAVLGGHLSLVQYLLKEKNVEALCYADKKTTPMHAACILGHTEIVRELFESISTYLPTQDCNLVSANKFGVTPLQLAAAGGHLPIISYLIFEKKCNPMCKDFDGSTPFHTAAAHGHLEVVKFFASHQFSHDLTLKNKKNDTLLHRAAAKGHLDVVKYLVEERNCNSTKQGYNGLTPLHIAAITGHLSVAKYLINCRDYNAYCLHRHRVTPLHAAAGSGNLQIVKYFTLEKNCDPSCKDIYGNTPLHYAAMSGHLHVIEFIVSVSETSAIITDKNERNGLHLASLFGYLNVVQYYIEKVGCNPSLFDVYQRTPLSLAAAKGHLSVVQYLTVSQKCDPLLEDAKGSNAFLLAAQSGHLNVVKFLACHEGCAQKVTDTGGRNALHLAAQAEHVSIVKFLIQDKGFDPSSLDHMNRTPLHWASLKGHVLLVKYLTSIMKSSSHLVDCSGSNALHLAAKGGHAAIVYHLVEENGYNPSSANFSKSTPLHFAAASGSLSIVEYLKDRKMCDPVCQDDDGTTPLHVAAKGGYVEIVKLLWVESEPLNKTGCNSLHNAANGGHLETVKFLIERKGYSPSCLDKDGNTPLHFAAAEGHVPVMQYLIQEKSCIIFTPNSSITPLHAAVGGGHLKAVQYILLSHKDSGADLVDSSGRNALHVAAQAGQVEILQYLVEHWKYNLFPLDFGNNTPLHFAAANGHLLILKYYIATAEFDLTTLQNSVGHTPLHMGAKYGKMEAVQLLSGVECSVPDSEAVGSNALHVASMMGHVDLVQYLVQTRKYNPSSFDTSNCTALHLAALYGHLNVINFLSSIGCDALVESTEKMITPFHYAAYFGHLNIVHFYVENLHIDPFTCEDAEKSTPLHYAAQNGCLEVVKYLANVPNEKLFLNVNSNLPIHFASSGGHVEVVKFLEPLNDIYAVDCDGHSCLHHAARGGHLKLIQYLIDKHSFDPEIKDLSGATPLHLASENGKLDVVSYLVLEKKCDPLCRDKVKNTSLHWAAREGHLEVVKFFAEVLQCSLLVEGESSKTPLDYAVLNDHQSAQHYIHTLQKL